MRATIQLPMAVRHALEKSREHSRADRDIESMREDVSENQRRQRQERQESRDMHDMRDARGNR
ncbi:MAG: hypothetical protein OEZ43_07280 [Gammaproteobacteria bacterium]|nr:hypothetical protein [Gammaproteobacteria bacterium]